MNKPSSDESPSDDAIGNPKQEEDLELGIAGEEDNETYFAERESARMHC
jgi:hypothetical protein